MTRFRQIEERAEAAEKHALMYARAADELRVRVASLESALAEYEQKCLAAAARFRKAADEQKRDGCTSSMSGEDNIPSHVISIARAISWEGAAALASVSVPEPAKEEAT